MGDQDIAALQGLLDDVPQPLHPLDVCALDGYLCGVLLQPRPVPASQWWPGVLDVEGRSAPAGCPNGALADLVRRRHAELEAAISRRQWFDPWVFAGEDDSTPAQCVLPWVAGFGAAMAQFEDLLALDDPELIEPLALIYQHVGVDDLEDAETLHELIESLEPPESLGEAVEQLVRAVLLMADVSRPLGRPGRTRGH